MERETAELASRAIDGDRDALSDLWRAHRRWVAAVLIAHGSPRDSAALEDLLQDIAMATVRNISTLRDPLRWRPWLRSIAINALRSSLRRRHLPGVTLNGSAHNAADDCAGPPRMGQGPDAIDSGEDAERALQQVLALPLIYREVLLLKALRDLSTRHIAEALDLPVKTVETRLIRGRRLILDALAPTPDSHRADFKSEMDRTR